MSIGVSDFTGLAHVILQVLPAHTAREVFHNETVICSGRRAISVIAIIRLLVETTSASGPGPATPAVAVTSAIAVAAASAAVAAAAGVTSGVLNYNPLSKEFFAIKFINGIISVPIVVEFNEAVSVFEKNVAGTAVTLEESL